MVQQREKSIELLNKGVALEIETVLQYIYFYLHFEDKGYNHLSRLFKQIAIKEMDHIERLGERIMFLKGDVVMKAAKPITYLESNDFDVNKVLQIAFNLEVGTVNAYNQWACETGALGDSGTKRLFEQLVEMEEEHQDTFDTEDDNLKAFGVNYLALQSVQRATSEAKEEEGSTGFSD